MEHLSAIPDAPGLQPTFLSVVIPVLHEENRINGTVRRVTAVCDRLPVEIIVVDGDPQGSTLSALDVQDVVSLLSAPGRAIQMNRGASRAAGEVILFLHADTLLPAHADSLIAACLLDPLSVGGCFDLGIDSSRWYFRITERYVACRTRITRVPFGDQAIFLRRAYFERIGGFREIPLMEDVELMARIRKRGDRIAVLPEKALTSARRWEREGVLRATTRNWMLQCLYCAGVPPEELAKYYR
ncbi:MAG: TIGR04283 family arsenosugar biosynthesis glycosyltransferase [Nitrospiraceae bacterium]|nr:TIGR04283 family arsenosugar biosynthesis glycosyltransferase [Nitrospiraceae bacterium]